MTTARCDTSPGGAGAVGEVFFMAKSTREGTGDRVTERNGRERFGELRSILNAPREQGWKWARILQTVDHTGRAEPEDVIAYLVASVSQWEQGMRQAPPRWLHGMGGAKRRELFGLVNQATLSALQGAPNMLLGQKLSTAAHIERLDVHTPRMPMRHILTQALSGEARAHLRAFVSMTHAMPTSMLLPMLARCEALETLVLPEPSLGKKDTLDALFEQERHPRLKHLRVSKLSVTDDRSARAFAAMAPTLETLAIEAPADPDITPAHLLRFVDMDRITALDLGDVPFGAGDLERLSAQKSLDALERAYLCSGQHLDGLCDATPSLRALRIKLRERDMRDAPWGELAASELESLKITTDRGQHLSPEAFSLLDAKQLRHLSLTTAELTSSMLDHIDQATSRALESFSLTTNFEEMSQVNSLLSWARRQPSLEHLALCQDAEPEDMRLTAEVFAQVPEHLGSLDLSGHAVATEALEALLTDHTNLRELTLTLAPEDTTWLQQATERGIFDNLDILDLTIEHLGVDAPARIIPAMRRRPLAWFALRSELLDREARAFGERYDRYRFVHGLEPLKFSCWHACSG